MNLVLLLFGFLILIGTGVCFWLFVRGRKEKKHQKEWEKKRRAARKHAKSQKEYEDFLKENLTVKGVTKSSDFHKRYSGKKKYQKVPTK